VYYSYSELYVLRIYLYFCTRLDYLKSQKYINKTSYFPIQGYLLNDEDWNKFVFNNYAPSLYERMLIDYKENKNFNIFKYIIFFFSFLFYSIKKLFFLIILLLNFYSYYFYVNNIFVGEKGKSKEDSDIYRLSWIMTILLILQIVSKVTEKIMDLTVFAD
jgi:hypothetical protein